LIFIFFIVHVFFAVTFYLIGAYIEAFLFLVLGIAVCFLFFPFSHAKKSESHAEAVGQNLVHGASAKTVALTFFRSYTLPLSLSLFYIASLGLLWSLSLTFDLPFTLLYIGFVGINILGIIFLKKSINQVIKGSVDSSLLQISILTLMTIAVLVLQMGELSYPELLISLAVVALLYKESAILATSGNKRPMLLLFFGSAIF
jgi:hypothetical protein